MGNQETCCMEFDSNKIRQINIKKTVIHPIKYGFIRQTQKSVQIVSTSEYIPQPVLNHIEQKTQNGNIGDLTMGQSFANISKNHQNQQTLHHNQIQIIIDNQTEEQDIDIRIPPNVSKLINLLKPFQKQLLLIDPKKVKKVRINNGKDIYKGQIDENGKLQGIGMVVKQNGNTLIGTFQNGLIQGESFFLFNDASYYKGKMKDNAANDQSGFFQSKHFFYTGGFENNCFHGKGLQIGVNHFFEGIYESNLKKNGVFAWELKKQKKSSMILSNSEFNAQTSNEKFLQKVKNYQYVFQGEFDVHQLFTGKGKLKSRSGTYIGDFFQGMKHGKGEFLSFEEIRYVGEYEKDKKSGYGILYNCDGSIAYEGEWKDGLPNGKGFSYDLQGKKTQGRFIDGINCNSLLNQ